MAYMNAATTVVRGQIMLAGHLLGTADSPQVGSHNAIASGDLHGEYSKADGSRAFSATVAGVTPTAASHLATKGYVDGVAQGLTIKPNALLATTAALTDAYTSAATTLTKTTAGAFQTVDGVAPTLNNLYLVKNQAGANEKDNGWYKLTTLGDVSTAWVLTRVVEADTAAELVEGSFSYITTGTANANTRWAVLVGPTTLGTDAITFTQLGDALSVQAGLGLVQNGAALDVQVDGVGIEIATDTLRLKDLGVVTAKLGATSVTAAKLGSDVAGTGMGGGNGVALTVTYGSLANNGLAAANANGTASSAARSDHVHTTVPATNNVALGGASAGWQVYASEFITRNVQAPKTGAYTILAGDCVILGDTTTAGFTIALPAASTNSGRWIVIKKTVAANTLTVAADGADVIDGVASKALTANGESMTFISQGSSNSWIVT